MPDLDRLVECIDQLGIIDLEDELIDWDESTGHIEWIHKEDQIKFLKSHIKRLLTDLSQGNTKFFTYEDTRLIYCLALVNDKGFNLDIDLMNAFLLSKLETANYKQKNGRRSKVPAFKIYSMPGILDIVQHYNPDKDIDIGRFIDAVLEVTKHDCIETVKQLDNEDDFNIPQWVSLKLSSKNNMTRESFARLALKGKHKLGKLQIPSFYPKK